MHYRLATHDDIPALVECVRSYYHEVCTGILANTFDADHIALNFTPCNGPDGVLVVAEDDDGIQGVIFYRILQNSPTQKQIKVANELVWHCNPELSGIRKIQIMAQLANLAESEMVRKGVRLVEIGTRLDRGAAGKLLEKMGYTATSVRWRKEL